MSEVRITAKTVDEWLNEVSYADDGSYIPSRFALEFVAFIKLVNGGEGEENKTPILHLKMLDTFGKINTVTRFVRVANMVHRGAAKTTLFGEYLFLYLAVYQHIHNFGKIALAIYVSDSIDNGVKNMRKNLEFRWENSAFLQQYIPKIRFTDIRWEFTNIEGNTFIVKAYGAKTGVRGTKELGVRPKLAVLDDLVSDEDARSKTVIEAIKTTVSNAIEYALHPKKNIVIWSGTPFNESDPLYAAVNSGAWDVNVYPVCEKFPCTEEEFRGSWPDRFDYDYVNNQYSRAMKEGKVESFYQEMMLRIMSNEERLIGLEDIKWYSLNSLLLNKGNFNFYITTDFATSEKQHADYSAISVWAVNHKGYIYWVDGIMKKQTMDKNIDDLFFMAQKYNPMGVGVEVSGQQGGFIPWINQEMLNRNIYFTLASNNNTGNPGIRPSTDKLSRFNVVLPWFKQGKMFFPNESKGSMLMKLGMAQLMMVSAGGIKSKNDDFIDSISQLGCITMFLPSAETAPKEHRGMWQADTGIDTSSATLSNYIV